MTSAHPDLLKKAMAVFENHQYSYALTLFKAIIRQYPSDATAHHYCRICTIKNAQAHKTTALGTTLRHIILAPLHMYALLLFFMESNERSVRLYEQLIGFLPLHISFYQKYVVLAQRLQQPNIAQHLLEEIQIIQPYHEENVKQLAQLYLQQGQLAQARQTIAVLQAGHPNDAEVLRLKKHLSALEALHNKPFQ